MVEFFKSESQRRIYQLTVEKGKVYLYWVSVWQLDDGSFNHSRGRDRLESWGKGLEICHLMAEKATRAEYVGALREFFTVDEKVAKQFYTAHG